MPRIEARTVVEHRERQRKALLEAGREELRAHGPAGVTLAAVGFRAGLARSSVYEYFTSASDLITELAVVAFAEWSESVNTTLAGTAPGWPRLHGYINATLGLVAEGRHEIAGLVEGYQFTAEQAQRFRQLHADLMSPLQEALAFLKVPQPEDHALLVQGMLDSATKRSGTAATATQLAAMINQLITHGLPAVEGAAKPRHDDPEHAQQP